MSTALTKSWEEKMLFAETIVFPNGRTVLDAPLTNRLATGKKITAEPGAIVDFRVNSPSAAVFTVDDSATDWGIENIFFTKSTLTSNDTPTTLTNPYCIKIGEDAQRGIVKNIYFGEGTIKGIYSLGRNCTIKDVRGTPLYMGMYLDHCGSTFEIRNVHFNVPWASAGSTAGIWQKANGTAFDLRRVDGLTINGVYVLQYNYGMYCDKSPDASWLAGPGGEVVQANFDTCNYGLYIVQIRPDLGTGGGSSTSVSGLNFTNCGFNGDVKAAYISSPAGSYNQSNWNYETICRFNNCNFADVALANAPAVQIARGDVEFDGCLFGLNPANGSGRNHMLTASAGSLGIQGGKFPGVVNTLAVRLQSGLRQAVIQGVRGLGGTGRIVGAGAGGMVYQIDSDMLPPEYAP